MQPCFPSASHGPSARFDIHYTDNPTFGISYNAGGAPVSNPFAVEGWRCGAGSTMNLSGSVLPGWNPLPPGWRNFPCRNGLSKHNNPYSPIGDGTLLDVGVWNIPGYQPQNWNDGVRLHTLLGSTELTGLLLQRCGQWRRAMGRSLDAADESIELHLLRYPGDGRDGGPAAADSESALAEYFPAVFRGEILYQNHVELRRHWLSPTGTGDAYSDMVKWMAAIDVDQAYAPWLTSTGNLTANFEVYDTYHHGSSRRRSPIGNAVDRRIRPRMTCRFSPAWERHGYGRTSRRLSRAFMQAKGRNIAMFPSITLQSAVDQKVLHDLDGDRSHGR